LAAGPDGCNCEGRLLRRNAAKERSEHNEGQECELESQVPLHADNTNETAEWFTPPDAFSGSWAFDLLRRPKHAADGRK
jgi:hypothetical protein